MKYMRHTIEFSVNQNLNLILTKTKKNVNLFSKLIELSTYFVCGATSQKKHVN